MRSRPRGSRACVEFAHALVFEQRHALACLELARQGVDVDADLAGAGFQRPLLRLTAVEQFKYLADARMFLKAQPACHGHGHGLLAEHGLVLVGEGGDARMLGLAIQATAVQPVR